MIIFQNNNSIDIILFNKNKNNYKFLCYIIIVLINISTPTLCRGKIMRTKHIRMVLLVQVRIK